MRVDLDDQTNPNGPIPVENDPRSVIEGKDPQLEPAVNEIMSRLKAQPTALPARPPAPVKTK
jgi:tricorn protease